MSIGKHSEKGSMASPRAIGICDKTGMRSPGCGFDPPVTPCTGVITDLLRRRTGGTERLCGFLKVTQMSGDICPLCLQLWAAVGLFSELCVCMRMSPGRGHARGCVDLCPRMYGYFCTWVRAVHMCRKGNHKHLPTLDLRSDFGDHFD